MSRLLGGWVGGCLGGFSASILVVRGTSMGLLYRSVRRIIAIGPSCIDHYHHSQSIHTAY